MISWHEAARQTGSVRRVRACVRACGVERVRGAELCRRTRESARAVGQRALRCALGADTCGGECGSAGQASALSGADAAKVRPMRGAQSAPRRGGRGHMSYGGEKAIPCCGVARIGAQQQDLGNVPSLREQTFAPKRPTLRFRVPSIVAARGCGRPRPCRIPPHCVHALVTLGAPGAWGRGGDRRGRLLSIPSPFWGCFPSSPVAHNYHSKSPPRRALAASEGGIPLTCGG